MSWNVRQGLAAGAAAVTVAITGGAFWLSYEHLHDVADTNGLPGVRAWAWPGVIDSFIIAGEILMLRASLRGGRFDWFACLLASVGSVGSIALNVAGVGTGAAVMQYVAAVPPSAALLAFAAVMRQIHGALAQGSGLVRTLGGAELDHSTDARKAITRALPELVPAGARLLPVIARPDHSRGTAKAITTGRPPVVPPGVRTLPLVPADMTTEDEPEQTEPEAEEPVTRPAIVNGWGSLGWPWLDDSNATAPPSRATTAAAAQAPPQVVTEVVTLAPSELRKRARKLNAEAVRDTGRPVTIDTLKTELNVSRRDAAELRRQVVDGSRS